MEGNDQPLSDALPFFFEVSFPGIWISENFDENSELRKKLKNNFDNFLSFIEGFQKEAKIPLEIQTSLCVYSDEKYNVKFKLHQYVLIISLAKNLNCSIPNIRSVDDIYEAYDLLNEKLDELKNIKSFNELNEKYPFLYNTYFLYYLSETNQLRQKMNSIGYDIDNYMNLSRNEKRKKYKNKENKYIYESYNTFNKFASDITFFVREFYFYFKTLISHTKEVYKWRDKNAIEINDLDDIEYKKLDLLLAANLTYLFKYTPDKCDEYLLYLTDFFERNKDNLESNLKVKVRNVYMYSNEKLVSFKKTDETSIPLKEVGYKDLYAIYNELMKDKQYIKQINIPNDYSNMPIDELYKKVQTLLANSQNNYKKISFDELSNKISAMIKNGNKNDENFQKKVQSLTKKITFLMDNKPITIIEGKNKFTNYLGYIYKNGYVVFDYIASSVDKSYGHAIYMIKLEDLNEYSNLSLSELRKMHNDRVIRIEHSDKWEFKLKTILNSFEDAESLLIPDEISEINMVSTLEQLEQLKDSLSFVNDEIENKIAKKRERIKKIKDIDDEIKQGETAEELYKSEQEDLLDDEDRLMSNGGESMDFVSLHELSKKVRKTYKRNPDVSLRTKLRTKDENGFIHCDFCDVLNGSNNMYKTNKSTRMFETHHIIPVSEGGIDNLYNTACLCPGCHTRIHSYLRLRKLIDANPDVELPDGVLGEYITFSEWGNFIQNVRKRIAKDTPEYLPNFDELFTPGYGKDYESEEQQSQEKIKFLINWNTFNQSKSKIK